MSSAMEKRTMTLADLHEVTGKAELIAGRIVHEMPTGYRPNQIAGDIFVSLKLHVRTIGRGVALTDNMGFAIPELPSGRESFSPDAAYYDGPLPTNRMRFIAGPPTFAVEVRSEADHGPAAEREMASKRLDYFDAGTRVVWDVDPETEIVLAYRAGSPAEPVVFKRGELADAEPAVPGWRMAVDDIFA